MDIGPFYFVTKVNDASVHGLQAGRAFENWNVLTGESAQDQRDWPWDFGILRMVGASGRVDDVYILLSPLEIVKTGNIILGGVGKEREEETEGGSGRKTVSHSKQSICHVNLLVYLAKGDPTHLPLPFAAPPRPVGTCS